MALLNRVMTLAINGQVAKFIPCMAVTTIILLRIHTCSLTYNHIMFKNVKFSVKWHKEICLKTTVLTDAAVLSSFLSSFLTKFYSKLKNSRKLILKNYPLEGAKLIISFVHSHSPLHLYMILNYNLNV